MTDTVKTLHVKLGRLRRRQTEVSQELTERGHCVLAANARPVTWAGFPLSQTASLTENSGGS